MDLQSTHSDLLNTNLRASSEDYHPLYQISTRASPTGGGTTTITKNLPGGENSSQQIAQIEWHSFSPDVLRFESRGVNGDAKEYIGKVKTMSTDRQFTSAKGHTYRWDGSVVRDVPSSLCIVCIEVIVLIQIQLKSSTGDEVARWHRKYYGVIHKSHPGHLEISQELLRDVDLDEIVVTWAYCQALIQRRWQASTTAVTSAGVSAGVSVGVALA
ncbi:hypothetical protein BDY19DRAFT_634889 [Irpex rosettiformis]|uniref:Uncharacterized protein n=1 Tax=Irpex rosettiformis TaxID=378272 RepID=A0ACB8UBG4_9APHY|nr:hypothetical protein BDY19DRAFT_634889 [Irpex rosettiformis]